jgi:hypothetical protein
MLPTGAEMFLKHQRSKMWTKALSRKFDSKSIMRIDEEGSGAVDEVEFLVHMLVRAQIVE